MKKTWEGIHNVLARKLKNTKPLTFIKDPNSSDPSFAFSKVTTKSLASGTGS